MIEKKLLQEKELLQSTVVANMIMNRQRKASGINSYEAEIGLSPTAFIRERLRAQSQVKWMDLCCGEGRALLQAAEELEIDGLLDRCYLSGIDLVDYYHPELADYPDIRFYTQSVLEWEAQHQYDLISCMHGLHYLGDKLKVVRLAANALAPQGLFVGQVDFDHIRIEDMHPLEYFRAMDWEYVPQHYMLRIQNPVQPQALQLEYLGADDSVGPNYTGANAVCSYYKVIK